MGIAVAGILVVLQILYRHRPSSKGIFDSYWGHELRLRNHQLPSSETVNDILALAFTRPRRNPPTGGGNVNGNGDGGSGGGGGGGGNPPGDGSDGGGPDVGDNKAGGERVLKPGARRDVEMGNLSDPNTRGSGVRVRKSRVNENVAPRRSLRLSGRGSLSEDAADDEEDEIVERGTISRGAIQSNLFVSKSKKR